jgi:hypothetical protein
MSKSQSDRHVDCVDEVAVEVAFTPVLVPGGTGAVANLLCMLIRGVRRRLRVPLLGTYEGNGMPIVELQCGDEGLHRHCCTE